MNFNDIRNKNLVRILEDINVVENRSSGIFTMIKELRDMKLEPPLFEEKRGDFWVTFRNHTLMTKEDLEWLRKFKLDFNENKALALTFIKRNLKMTNGDYQRLNNTNRDKALLEIKELIKKGVIKSEGIGSGTYYVLNELTTQDNDVPPKIIAEGIAEKDREKEILDFCCIARSKREIAEYLGLKNLKYFEKTYIRPLLEKNKLEMTIPDKPTSRNQKYIARNN